MKIAISATGASLDDPLDQRFGRCPCFVIADAEGSVHDTVENIHAERGSGAGIQAACLLIERGVSVVLTGRCGPNASETLVAAGVGIITGCSGTIRQALERHLAGESEASVDEGVSPAAGGFTPGPGRGMGRASGRGMGGGPGRGRGRAKGMSKTPRS
jgi:predicted Fe-Mo cluster-binding NifX family protein